MTRTDPRVFARPFELHRGQSLTPRQLVDRLNDLGYAHRATRRTAGRVHGRARRHGAHPARRRPQGPDRAARLRRPAGRRAAETTRASTRSSCRATKKTDRAHHARRAADHRARHRRRARSAATCRCRRSRSQMVQAVLAIEDRRFYDHPGHRPDRHRRRRLQQRLRQQGLPGERQHPHAAARQEHVPDAGEDARSAR